jgi:hypothetical protein
MIAQMGPEKSARDVRTMAIVCAFLGPLLAVYALGALGAAIGVAWLEREHLLVPNQLFPDVRMVLRFSELSSWVSIPLGLLITGSAIATLKSARRGRPWLAASGWISVLGSIGLVALWEYCAFESDARLETHLSGSLFHLLQAGLIARASWFLTRREVRTALDPG